jgi:uncharacterized lipoprotein YbaY
MIIVTGTITFEEGVTPPNGATAYIRLIDTTLIDAAAKVIDEQIIRNIDWSKVPVDGLEFCLKVVRISPRNRYEVSVLIDCDGDGRISPGDYYSTQSYPVLMGKKPQQIKVVVRSIR